jgi:predicted phosphodiesterase
MKIALLGDVHANLPALEAVLSHARQHGVSEYWNVGDFVGYGAFPNEVIKLLRKIEAKALRQL